MKGPLLRRTAVAVSVLLLLAGCGTEEVDGPGGVAEEPPAQAGPSGDTSDTETEAEDVAEDALPAGHEAAADYVDDTFEGSGLQQSLVEVFEAFGSPDVEQVRGVSYDRSGNVMRVDIDSAVSDPADLRQLGWMATNVWTDATALGESDLWDDLAADFELSLNDESWRCTHETMLGIADGQLVERHWHEACS